MALTEVNSLGIKDLEVKTGDIAADAVTGAKIADDQINSEHYVAASIDHEHLANDCVDGDNLADNACDSEHYTDGSIDHEHLANDCVDGDNIADNSVGLAAMAHGTDGNLITYDASGAPAHVVTGSSGQVLTSNGAGAAPTFQTSTSAGSFRNLIINGAMQVNQYGSSSTTPAGRVCDRFRPNWGGADEALTYSKHALTSSDTGPWEKGFKHSLHIQNGNQTSGAGSSDYASINYRTEAQDIVNSGWVHTSASSYITFSFWVKSSVAQNFYVVITNNDGTNYNYPVETGSLSANTWTKVTKTIPGNSNLTINNDNGKGLEFDITMFRGTDTTGSVTLNQWAATDNNARCPDMTSTWWTTNDATFEITGVQLEVGDSATEFEHRTYADELRRCLRYYFKITKDDQGDLGIVSGWCRDTERCHGNINFPVPMRDNPSSLETSGTAGDYAVAHKTSGPVGQSVPAFDSATQYSASITLQVTGNPFTAGECGRIQGQTSDAYLAWSSEL